jgi:DNA ligase (NAD+)
VLIHKAAEIIPEIISVDFSKREPTSIPFVMIDNCPVCDSKLQKIGDSVDLFCINEDCEGRNINKIIHYSSRKALDIDTLGERVVEELHNIGILNNIVDIYKLKDNVDVMSNMYGFGKKKIDKLLSAIEDSKNKEISKFVFGLGITHVGEKYSKILVKHYKTIDELIKMEMDFLLSINDFGIETANSLYNFFHNDKNIATLRQLQEFGVSPTSTTIDIKKNDFFMNKKIVITGTLEAFKRDELTSHLENIGAKVSSSISSKTDYLICGVDAGSKLAKAIELNIKVIYEKELKELLNAND